MVKVVSIFFAGLLGMASHIASADQSTCVAYEDARAAALKAAASDSSATFMDFGDEQAQALVKAINAEPPPSDLHAERVLILERADKDKVEIGLLVDGCFRGPTAVSEAQWRKLRDAAFGGN